jgi:hypothetical protein
MLKLYRELAGGAFATWAASGAQDTSALAASGGAKDALLAVLAARKQVSAF